MVWDGKVVKIMIFIILILLCFSLLRKDSRYAAIPALNRLVNYTNEIIAKRELTNEFQKQSFLDGKIFF